MRLGKIVHTTIVLDDSSLVLCSIAITTINVQIAANVANICHMLNLRSVISV
jgi:hypothetical protein